MLSFKAGVLLAGMKPQIVAALVAIQSVLSHYGYDTTVTEVMPTIPHMVDSLHSKGLAIDIRRVGSPRMARMIAEALGENYDVVVEPYHLHIEYDPKES